MLSTRTFMILLITCFLSFGAVEKGPYLLYEGENTSMSVMWQLDVTQGCTINWGKTSAYELGSSSTTEYGSDHQHKYKITNLEPGTQYYYEITGVGNGSFTTSPQNSASSVKLFAYGDTRTYPSDHNDVAAEIVKQYTADNSKRTAVLFSGDYVSTGSSESDWTNQFFPRNQSNIVQLHKDIPNIGTIGNHEGSSGSAKLRKYYPFPHVGGHYWAFDYGPVRVYIVDQYTGGGYSPGSAQYNWLQSDLASTTKEWKMVVFHAPGYSAGGGHSNNTSVQNNLQPLFEQYGVDFVINGDNHYYSRAVVNEVQHITTGGGGAPLYSPNSSASYIVKTDRSNHFCEFDIKGGVCTVTARRATGTVIETFDVIHETTVEIVSPSKDTAVETGDILTVEAVVMGSSDVSNTELLVNGTSVDSDNSSPYEFSWTPSSAGSYELKVSATVGGLPVVSSIKTVTVTDPVPEVTLTSPLVDTVININSKIDITASVESLGMTVDSVCLIVDNVSIASDLSSPYSFSWSSNVEKDAMVAVKAWINGSGYSSKTVSITVIDFSTTTFTDTFVVMAENDDAEEGVGGVNDTVFVNNPDLELVDDYDFMKDKQIVGIRFDKVDIPKKTLITGAWIQFVADESSDTVTSINFKGHAHDNSATFAASKGNISTRATTTASVNWEPLPWTQNDEGADQKSPNLKSIVSEVMERSGWQSGNPITFIIDGSGRRVATSFNTGGSSGASKLIISYKLGGSVPNSVEYKAAPVSAGFNMISSSKIGITVKKAGNYKIKVFSLDGKVLYKSETNFKTGSHNVHWNGSNISKGIYLVSLEGMNNKFITKAIFK